MKTLQVVIITSALVLSNSVHSALVSTTYSTENIIYTYLAPGAVDTYGLGIYDFNFNSNVSISYTYDNDFTNATSVYSNPPTENYRFQSPAYNASLMINGVNVLNSNSSAITIQNDLTQPPEGSAVPQYWIDAGFPSNFSGPSDALWMGGYSDDFTYNPAWDGLIFSIDFFDLSGNWLTSSDAIPASAPDLTAIDFAVLNISQYENNILQFEAAGIVVNNISAIPVPAAVWLFGSGLFGSINLSISLSIMYVVSTLLSVF